MNRQTLMINHRSKRQKVIVPNLLSFFTECKMPRKYERDPHSRSYKSTYSDSTLEEALQEVCGGASVYSTANKYGIPYGTLFNKFHGNHHRNPGHPTVFEPDEEEMFAVTCIKLSDWGFPLTELDLRVVAQNYLNNVGRNVAQFVENLPGPDWSAGFLKRHPHLTKRFATNISNARASVSPSEMMDYFGRLKITLTDDDGNNIPPSNIINFDETSITDDPGRRKVICKRGEKYIKRILNSSHGSTSLMVTASADGTILPLYVVFKSKNLYTQWSEDGPEPGEPFCNCRGCSSGARYNNTPSGWFDTDVFTEYFKKIIIPHTKNLEGKKVVICDNLSAHINPEVTKISKENNIAFVCLPPNCTHIAQPLDVAFFRGMKSAWRNILDNWKSCNRKVSTIPKGQLAGLIKSLFDKKAMPNMNSNAISGFAACGIYPFNPDRVLKKVKKLNESNVGDYITDDEKLRALVASIDEIMAPVRDGLKPTRNVKRTKAQVPPGTSITSTSFASSDTSNSSDHVSFENTETLSDTEDIHSNLQPLMLKVGDFVIVKYTGKKASRFYLGQIAERATDDERLLGNDWHVKYMRMCHQTNCASFHPTDNDLVSEEDIQVKVSPPEPRRRDFWFFSDSVIENYKIE